MNKILYDKDKEILVIHERIKDLAKELKDLKKP